MHVNSAQIKMEYLPKNNGTQHKEICIITKEILDKSSFVTQVSDFSQMNFAVLTELTQIVYL